MDPDQAFQISQDACKSANYDTRALPWALQAVRLIFVAEYEVSQGGVLGWLGNYGEYAPDTAHAYEAIGATRSAAIVREILAFFPASTPAADAIERSNEIQAVLGVAEAPWNNLGDRLLEPPEDVSALLQRFVDEHEGEFVAAERH